MKARCAEHMPGLIAGDARLVRSFLARAWPHLCAARPEEPWGVYRQMRLRAGERCGPEWIEARMAALVEISISFEPASRRLLTEWWPHLCRTGPYAWARLRDGTRGHYYPQCRESDR